MEYMFCLLVALRWDGRYLSVRIHIQSRFLQGVEYPLTYHFETNISIEYSCILASCTTPVDRSREPPSVLQKLQNNFERAQLR
jgi:hypothetical protein